MTSWPKNRRIAAPDLLAAKERQERWTMLTCYDAMMGPLFEQAGAKALLVGDSAAMVVYGYADTIAITLDELIPLAAAVVRSTSSALVVGDLPFGSYQQGPSQAVESAVRLMKEAGVGAVKLEGGAVVAPQVSVLTASGIPVIGHLGLTPQSVHAFGGYRVQGRGDAGEQLVADAKALESAGASAVVLEAVPMELGSQLTSQISIPTIGIGAGPDTDAQVMVWQDLLGLGTGHQPKFVKRYADLATTVSEAVNRFVNDVESGAFPDTDHSYH